MKELGMEVEYVEQPGITPGPVITPSQEAIFGFFDKHSKYPLIAGGHGQVS
jgi:hypothetical protein